MPAPLRLSPLIAPGPFAPTAIDTPIEFRRAAFAPAAQIGPTRSPSTSVGPERLRVTVLFGGSLVASGRVPPAAVREANRILGGMASSPGDHPTASIRIEMRVQTGARGEGYGSRSQLDEVLGALGLRYGTLGAALRTVGQREGQAPKSFFFCSVRHWYVWTGTTWQFVCSGDSLCGECPPMCLVRPANMSGVRGVLADLCGNRYEDKWIARRTWVWEEFLDARGTGEWVDDGVDYVPPGEDFIA